MTKIDTFIVDLGDVIFKPDWEKINNDVIKEKRVSIFKPRTEVNYHEKLNRGQITPEEYFEILKGGEDHENLDILSFIETYKKNYERGTEINQEMVEFIKELKNKNINLICITDTNPIHEEVNKKRKIFELFDKVYCSYKTGKLKRDEGFFDWIVEENDLTPENTIFIDDNIKNIECAKSSGINTIQYKTHDKFKLDLKELIPSIREFSLYLGSH